ncbi:Ig-like domain-containing protein [Pseudomonas sp.]|uniref:Ig-like domain-containing protein n=1 Tax=Pseudomonas sp. TaxID=306 RepID=UPI003D1158D5
MADQSNTPSVPSRLVRGRPRPLALEQRFVFDGAAAADAADVADSFAGQAFAEPVEAPAHETTGAADVVPATTLEHPSAAAQPEAAQALLFHANDEHPTLTAAAENASEQIRQFLAQASDEQLFELFHGEQSTPGEQWSSELARLRASIADGTLEIGVTLLDNAQLQGALAAYAPQGPEGAPVIFVNRDWLAVLDAQQVSRLLVEEYGHHLDHMLNQGLDTSGDEGQRFAAVVNGLDTGTPGFAADDDHATLQLDGTSIDVEFATLTFSNAYEVNAATTPAGKESNSHDFVFDALGQVIVNDAVNSRFFSGNDVSATAVTIGDTTYYGWISRPIKSGGVVRGFYFWTDADFTSLALAQADGNKDGDGDVTDNRGFLLVVDQAWFDGLDWKNEAANLKNVGSSSDRVDSALNALVGAPVAPVAVADTANGTPGTPGGAALEAGASQSGSAAVGNVLSNDTSADSKRVTAVGTGSASQAVGAATTADNGTVVVGLYGTLTIGADGSYLYLVNDANPQVEALRSVSDTLVDTFTYRMTDAAGATAITTLSVTIRGANDAPLANDDYNTAKESIAGSGQYGESDKTGSQAIGNVLDNDTDVDRYGESKTVVTIGIEGTATGNTAGTTTFNTSMSGNGANSIALGALVYRLNADGSRTQLFSAGGAPVTVESKTGSGGSIGFTFSDSAALSGITSFSVQKSNGQFVDGTIHSTTVTSSTTLTLSGVSGNIAVGMMVDGTGLTNAPTISSINYDSNGQVISVELSAAVAVTNQALSFSSSQNAGITLTGQYGSLLLNADGSYTYTPTANNPALSEGQSAVEHFQYTLRDASGATSSASLFITVTGSGTNDPNAVADTAIAIEQGGTANGTPGTNPTGNLLDNDTTPSGPKQVVSARTTGSATGTPVGTGTEIVGLYGKLTLSADGSYVYQVDNANPSVQALRDTSTTLSDTFIYTIANGLSANGAPLQDSATLTITIQGANDTPVAADTSATAVEAGGVNDSIAGYAPHGNVLDSVSDLDDARSELRVTAVRLGEEKGSGTSGVVGSALTGLYGSLTLGADGNWSYVLDNGNPDVQALTAGQTLVEHFNYTVMDRSGSGLSDIAVLTITIEGATDTVAVNSVFVNEASPYAVFTVSGSAGVAVSLALSDSEGLPASDTRATLSGTDADIGSTLEYFDGSDWVSYTPGSSVVIPSGDTLLVRVAIKQDDLHEGNESFTLTATTSGGDSSTGIGTINDEGEGDLYLADNQTGAPDSAGGSGYPTLDDDRPTLSVADVSITEGQYAEFVVSIDKPSTEPISFAPSLVSGSADVGTDTGTQLERFDGNDWVALDGPVGIAAGELSVRLRIATVDDGLVETAESFTLRTGPVSGTVTNLGGADGVATILNNDVVNDAPVAADDSLTATEDTPVTYSAAQLLGNDVDADDDTLAIASVTSGIGGSAVLNPDGSVTFTPAPNFNGQASFTYTVTDGSLVSNTATVTINVAAVNDAPVAADDSLTATEDTPVTYSAAQLLGNDVDADDDTLAIASVTSGIGGSAVLNPDGSVTFTPAPNFNGQASFTYTVTDGSLVSNTATVTINVAAVNDAPVAADDSLTATEDTPVTYSAAQLLGNDADADDDTLAIASVTSGTGGSAVLNPDGSVTFTPAPNFNGQASFTYTVTDGSLVSNTATVTINVAAVNDAPVAADDSLTATEDTPVTYSAAQLLGNDVDADDDTLAIASVTSGAGGSAVLNPDGSVTFTPAPNFNGQASFTYTVTDGSLVSNTATVTINVAAVNDPATIGGTDTGSVTEDQNVDGLGKLATGGSLSVTDPDAGDTRFQASVTPSAGALGSLSIATDGSWSYSVANAAVQHLKAGESKLETFTVRTVDGTEHTVSVTIHGVNDAAVFAPGGQQGHVQEDTLLSAEGQLNVTDMDQGEAVIVAQSATPGLYGEFSIDVAGRWRYVLDNASPAVQALGTADSRSETFTVTSLDGTTATVTITVQGLDEPVVPPVEPPPAPTAGPQPVTPPPPSTPAMPEPVAPPPAPAPFDGTLLPAANLAAPSPVATPLIAAVQSRELDLAFHGQTSFGDLYTQRNGFPVVVIEAPQARLSLYHGVADQYADAGAQTTFSVPYDAFAHTDPNERILLSATLANGQPLPGWIRFDPQSGKFELNAPTGYRGELTIKIVARDSQGREASALFRFNVGERRASAAAGRAGLSDQLRQAAPPRSTQAFERALAANRAAGETRLANKAG